jgi:enamine deaminase RidA (YjgF/YER057c/UK114 family)
MANFDVVVPPGLQGVYDTWHFAPAVIKNGMIYCSGIIGTSPDGNPISASAFDGANVTLEDGGAALSDIMAIRDPEAQFEAAFEGVKSVLTAAGAGLEDIVEMTTYHVNIAEHMPVFMAVKDRYIKEPYPAWTAVGVSELVIPCGLMELRVIAAGIR